MKNEFRHAVRYLLIFLFISIVSGCSKPQQTIILISIDGFRWDYPEKAKTPNLDYLIKHGVRAKRLIPCFPTKTFPNHYSIVTGLYPEHHGIIANNMYDPQRKKYFKMSMRDAVRDPAWWGGEPIWVTVEKQGLRTAPIFWPGSETKIKGVQPTYWQAYDGSISNADRVKQVLHWFDLPADKRPAFMTLYFSTIDDLGHKYGPEAKELVAGIAKIDSTVGLLLDGLKRKHLLSKTNILVVSDHGMAAISPDRVIYLDDYIDMKNVEVIDWNPVAGLNVKTSEDKIYNRLKDANPHLTVYRKADMPARFHYDDNPRIPQIIAIADEGWSITSHKAAKRNHLNGGNHHFMTGGNHGFDNRLTSMGATFIASGPAFEKGLIVEPFENIQLYNLMAAVLKIKPAANDGHFAVVKGMLR